MIYVATIIVTQTLNVPNKEAKIQDNLGFGK